jgi:hypothetical protein
MTGFSKQQRAPFRRAHSHVNRIYQPGVPPSGVQVASFNGTNSYIRSLTGNDISVTAFTFMALVKPSQVTDFNTIFSIGNGNTTQYEGITWDSSSNKITAVASGNTFDTGGTPISTSSWYLWIISKAAGTATPRMHEVKDGAAMANRNFSTTMADIPGTLNRMTIGAKGLDALDSGFAGMQLAFCGLWGEDTTDGTAATYVDFSLITAKTNAVFFTGGSLVNAGTMVDSGSSGNSETARNNVTTGIDTVPSWFLNFPTGGGGGGGFSRLIVPSQRSSRMMVPVTRKRAY